MKGQSFIAFLLEQEGKADRQKVLTLSALVGSSVLAQLMFAGVTQANHCPGVIQCGAPCPAGCTRFGPCVGGLETCDQ